jgi:hypothetical protein
MEKIKIFDLSHFDIHKIFQELKEIGATSFKLLRDDFRILLYNKALNFNYKKEPTEVNAKKYIVKMEVESFTNFPNNSLFYTLKETFQNFIINEFKKVGEEIFETPLNFNSMILLRYPKASMGISPHQDNPKYINLICIFVIKGKGKFFICKNEKGDDAIEISSNEGNVIILRAPGFLKSKQRPFHFIKDIEEERYTFGLRQEKL